MRLPGTYQLVIEHPMKFFGNANMRFAASEDWKKTARIQREGCTLVPPLIERHHWEPTTVMVRRWLQSNVWIQKGSVTAIDFEATVDGLPVCLGLWNALLPFTPGICIPYLCQGGAQYWTPDERQEIDFYVKEFLENPDWLKTGQNLVGYDTGFPPFNKRGLVKMAWDIDVQGIEIDTYPLHHICFAELRHSLDLQSSIVTDLSRYKQELHEGDDSDEDDDAEDDWSRVLEKKDEDLRTYCLKDCFSQSLARRSLIAEAHILG